MSYNLFDYNNLIIKILFFQDMHKTNCEDDNDNIKQPLLYLMINQPNIYFSQQHLSKKIQVCIFYDLISKNKN